MPLVENITNSILILFIGICIGILLGFIIRGYLFRKIYRYHVDKGNIVETEVMQGILLLFKHEKDESNDGTGQGQEG